jgi:uncharacterized protein YicC (UPF0701 family)
MSNEQVPIKILWWEEQPEKPAFIEPPIRATIRALTIKDIMNSKPDSPHRAAAKARVIAQAREAFEKTIEKKIADGEGMELLKMTRAHLEDTKALNEEVLFRMHFILDSLRGHRFTEAAKPEDEAEGMKLWSEVHARLEATEKMLEAGT